MVVPVVLLIVMGMIGSLDGFYYHLWKFRLYKQPSARAETITHIVRAFSYTAVLLLLTHTQPQGGWYWAIAAIFGLELLDDVVDITIEPKSREPLGGLPPREYLIHMVVMAISGGVWVSYLVLAWPNASLPTALAPLADGALPTWLVWEARILAVGSLGFALLEGTLMLRHILTTTRTESPQTAPQIPSP